jgi:hypothetical protein
VASSANLLVVDTEVVERLSAPAENELQNVVKLFQRKVVRYRNQPGDERADFQQYDPEGQTITTRWRGHEPTLPIPDARSLGGLQLLLNAGVKPETFEQD